MKTVDPKNRLDVYKKILKTIFKITQSINKNIENNARLEILIPGLSQLGIMFTSLLKLFPNKDGNLDLTSICSISRSIIEFTNTIHFYSLADIASDEMQFRIDLFNYLSFSERINNSKQLGATPRKLNDYDLTNIIEKEYKENLIKNKFFNKLKEKGQIKEDNIKNSKYISRLNIQKERKIQINEYDNFYSFYSTFVHSSPLAIELYREFIINQDDLIKKQYKYATGIIEMSAGFIAVLLLETKKYTNVWSEFLENDEIEVTCKFANKLNKC